MKTQQKHPFRGLYFIDKNGEITEADSAEVNLVLYYNPQSNTKKFVNEERVTILSKKTNYAVNEPVKIVHLFESSSANNELYINGPKQIYDEYVNSSLKTETAASNSYPWTTIYDGEVIQAPGIDYAFDITEYQFNEPGTYLIQWKPVGLESNLLKIIVK